MEDGIIEVSRQGILRATRGSSVPGAEQKRMAIVSGLRVPLRRTGGGRLREVRSPVPELARRACQDALRTLHDGQTSAGGAARSPPWSDGP